MELFKGSGVALITPFKKDGSIDYITLRKLIDFQIENNTDAIIITGTTGESATLSYIEHLSVIEECIEHVNGRIPVIAGTGSNCTKSAINMSKEAENLGADGLLIVTPYYNKTTQKGLISHYSKISEKVNIPIILYNVPSRTGLNIEPNTVKELVEKNKNIKGIKEASGNINNVSEIKELLGEKINIYSGNDDQIVPILSLGGVGVISVIANILPQETHDLVMNYLNGNIDMSKKEQLKMLKLVKALFKETNPIPIKKAMELLNMINGTLREPLVELEEDHKKQLIKEMKNYGMDI
ncbi:MAG: 4-hydroxy-tetrahydrodipicolinate synthase [Bacilli bacterium]